MIILLLLLEFLLELVAFVCFAFSAVFLPIDKSFQIFVGILLLVVLIAFWAMFMSPKAPRKFSLLPYYVFKTIIYAISAVVLFTYVNQASGIVFIILAVLDEVVLFKHNTISDFKHTQ